MRNSQAAEELTRLLDMCLEWEVGTMPTPECTEVTGSRRFVWRSPRGTVTVTVPRKAGNITVCISDSTMFLELPTDRKGSWISHFRSAMNWAYRKGKNPAG